MKLWKVIVSCAAIVAAGPLFAPQLLAFPYKSKIGASRVWSVDPISKPELQAVLERSDRLVEASPIAKMPEGRDIFLTDGGWRWTWLTSGSYAFGISRAINDAVVVNRSDIARDEVYSPSRPGGVRALSGVIAHETCHGMERRRYGLLVDVTKPEWLREGYCDYVAQESNLTSDDVALLRVEHPNHPAIVYYDGRRRVARELAKNGGSVDKLFAAY